MKQTTEEKRSYRLAELRVQGDEADGMRITGLAVPYNELSDDLGGFKERFSPGAFRRSLDAGGEVYADVEHDPTLILGRRSKGTLQITDDPSALRVAIKVPDTQRGRDTAEDVRNGNLDGMSIAFVEAEDEFRQDPELGVVVRTINAAELRAVTLTSRPAYRRTAGTVALRSLEAWKKQQEEEEKAEGGRGKGEEEGPDTAILRRRLEVAEAEV